MNVDPQVLAVVAAVSVVQSLFGVGVLLFGTPLLLLLGLPFVDVLTTVLPVSIGISLAQIVRDRSAIDLRFVARAALWSGPPIAMALGVALSLGPRLGLLVAALLALYAMKGVSPRLAGVLGRLAAHERAWLLATGVVHGLTNLGGSMLTLVVHQKGWPKRAARATIAACYIGFAALQLAIVLATHAGAAHAVAGHAGYVAAGLAMWAVVGRLVDRRLDDAAFARAFSGLLLASAALVTYRSI